LLQQLLLIERFEEHEIFLRWLQQLYASCVKLTI
jgi:hypothetical protein